MTPTHRLLLTIATVVAVALACATTLFSYLAAASAESPRCAGQTWLAGHRVGVDIFVGFPFFCAFCAIPLLLARKNEQICALLASFDIKVFEFASFRLTYGEFLVYSSLFGFVAMSGLVTAHSFTLYMTISEYCHSVAASG
jgi:hypothetical protein